MVSVTVHFSQFIIFQGTFLNKRLMRQAKLAQTALFLTIGLATIAGGVIVVQAFFLSQIVNQVFLEGQTLGQVQNLLLLLFGLSLLRAAFTWLGQVTAQRVASVVKNDLRQRLAAHMLALGPAYTQGERSGELVTTTVEGVEALDVYFSQYLPQLATAALVPLTILAIVFPLDVASGLVLLLTAPLIPVFMILIGSHTKTLTQRQWTTLSRMSAHFLDVLQGLTTLKLLGRSREQIDVIALISDRFRETTMGVLRFAFLSALTLELLATLSTAIVAVEIGLRLLYGYLKFEQAFFVLILAPEFYLPLRQLGSRFHAATSGVTAAKRIFEILDSSNDLSRFQESTMAKAVTPAAHPGQTHPGTIHFNNVFYSYDEGQRPALRGVSFNLAPGEKVALVGPSGAGKSTIAHLLLRFIEPSRGHISVNGQPLSKLDPTAWRAHLAWVPQQPYLFHASIADNIRLACPEASPAEIEAAACQAHADAFISALPQGYDTLVGERGTRLSGGQAQRIALARAFLKNAPLLILDEATAHLDPEHESQVQVAVEQLIATRTVLFIAHRLNTVASADKILVVNNGQIVESGPHQVLLRQPGLYQRLMAAYQGAG